MPQKSNTFLLHAVREILERSSPRDSTCGKPSVCSARCFFRRVILEQAACFVDYPARSFTSFKDDKSS